MILNTTFIFIILRIDGASIDENISLIYEEDDTRLCTIQRAIPKQKLGFTLCYCRRESFHYIKFYDDFESSLAYRAGIRNFDRIIELNSENIENDTEPQLSHRFNIDRHLPVQMLSAVQPHMHTTNLTTTFYIVTLQLFNTSNLHISHQVTSIYLRFYLNI